MKPRDLLSLQGNGTDHFSLPIYIPTLPDLQQINDTLLRLPRRGFGGQKLTRVTLGSDLKPRGLTGQWNWLEA